MKLAVSLALTALFGVSVEAQKKSILDLTSVEIDEALLTGVLPVIYSNNSTDTSAPECVDDESWWSGYGNCTSYSAGEYNDGFCESDGDVDTGILASEACPKSCNTCPELEISEPEEISNPESDESIVNNNKTADGEVVAVDEDLADDNGSEEFSDEDAEFSVRAADLSGCGINRDCPACAATFGCTWNKKTGCTAGFGQSVCDAIATPDSSKADCEAYTGCKSCTEQAGCIFYKGSCTYSRGTACLNDPFNCVNYPSQCPPEPSFQPPQPQPQPQPTQPVCIFPPCFTEGSYCNSFQACGPNQVCSNSRCTAVKQCYYPPCGVAGAVCNFYQDCGNNGLTCMNGRCMTDSSINVRKPVTCNPPFAYCPQGEQCVNNVCEAVFVPPPFNEPSPDNQACSFFSNVACPLGQVCDGTKCVTDPNVPKLDICFYDYQCPNGYTCVNKKCSLSGPSIMPMPIFDSTNDSSYQPKSNTVYQTQTTTYQPNTTTATYKPQSNTSYQPQSNTSYQPQSNTSYQQPQPNTNYQPQPNTTYQPKPSTYQPQLNKFCVFDVHCGQGLVCENGECVTPSSSFNFNFKP